MALISRRAFATLLGAAVGACAGVPKKESKTAPFSEKIRAYARRQGAPKVLVFMPDLPATRAVWNALVA